MEAPDLTWAGPYATVVFDLDGTLAEPAWPDRSVIGEPILEGIALLVHYADCGYAIAIHTARPARDESLIWAWVSEHGLPVDRVYCGKPLGALYVDDRAFRPDYVKENR